jgi:hypothetical protein
MTRSDDSVARQLVDVGFRIIGNEPPGLFGAKKRVEDIATGKTYLADIVDTADSQLLKGACLTSAKGYSFDETFIVKPFKSGWFDEIYYQILSCSGDSQLLSHLRREDYASTPQQAITVAMGVIKSIEYLGRSQVCHRSICPSSIYKTGERFRLGELWTIELTNHCSYYAEYGSALDRFIRNDARLFSAPDFRDDVPHAGAPSDVFSFALLVLYLFSGIHVDNETLRLSSDRIKTILQICPDLTKEFANCLARALEPKIAQRTHALHLREEVAFQAIAFGMQVPDEYFERAYPSHWDDVRRK